MKTETVKEFNSLFEPIRTKTWELTVDKVNHIESYKVYDILPSLMFIIDKQLAKYDEDWNKEPYIAYNLMFQWLGFYIELTYNKKL